LNAIGNVAIAWHSLLNMMIVGMLDLFYKYV
jgi:hypothetical protein